MNISKVDLNLLVYLDTLLRECNVTRSANQLNITQPAMSNGLKRLRALLNDPILVRTSDGMVPTERAKELQPVIRGVLLTLEETLQPNRDFEPASSNRVFRIMASDYAASTLAPMLLSRLQSLAPDTTLDIVTPSDVTFHDVENGKVDMAINRFDNLPQSFHQKRIWKDSFSCVVNANNPVLENYSLDAYLKARHIWVSKTGFGVGVGMDPADVQKLGWVDEALAHFGKHRNIASFTRNYHVAIHLAKAQNLIATLPTKVAKIYESDNALKIVEPPFPIPPFELDMIWSPLLHRDASHIWLRQQIADVAETLSS
ncbi:LysR family transcriptional regulator [Pseudoalteromonas sp. MMG024]|uniref:LysR family transcriptional regulator n=1 Tax=Pseudoalteromonas sp. MMG024 TaxID=2909980 RepID=UPI001F321FF3|nr:LysR family transcriptional regulator [Pseudoalteromonas sp. MMG024]MCF6455349.1 LysR family transcriptional regulator [Pseudoalteromonas sp. MMG024]